MGETKSVDDQGLAVHAERMHAFAVSSLDKSKNMGGKWACPFSEYYQETCAPIRNILASHPGTISHVQVHSGSDLSELKASLLMSDVTRLNLSFGPTLHLLGPAEANDPVSLLPLADLAPTKRESLEFFKGLSFSAWAQNGPDVLGELEPFARCAQVVLEPSPVMFTWRKVPESKKKTFYQTHQHGSLLDTHLRTGVSLESKSVNRETFGSSVKDATELLRFSLPSLDALSLAELHSVMRDNHDSLISFRNSLRQCVAQVRQDGKSSREVYHDILAPGVETVSKIIKHRNKSSLAKFSTMSTTFAVGLAMIPMIPATHVALALTGALTTYGYQIKKLIEEHMSQSQLAINEPQYLMWKIQKKTKSKHRKPKKRKKR